MTLFGAPVRRIEDESLLRGRARFADDIVLPGLLEAAFVRSPYAHALVRGIDKGAALALPGVRAVLTLADLAPFLATQRLATALPSPSYRLTLDRPVLADGEVVHVGEPVAVVVAANRYVAEDAAALVAVEYEPLDAVADCRAALEPGAPRAHRGAPHNLAAEFEMGYGDVAAAFAGAAHVFRAALWQHRGGSHSLEGRGTVAAYDANEDRLTLWSSTQAPHAALRLLAEILGRDESRLRVVTPELGGGFGPKLVFYPEDAALAAAALLLRAPVKWIEDRREHFVATTQERDAYWDMEIAVDAEARLRGVRGRMIHDHGAYTARGVNVPFGAAQALTLPYEVPAYHLAVRLAVTNKVPVTPVRGAGQPQGAFVMERLMDCVARGLGLDRAEVRRRNLVPAAAMPREKPLKTRGGIGVLLDSGDYPRCQALALAHAGWAEFPARQQAARAAGRFLGIGLANYVEGTGRGPFEGVTVRVLPTGKVQVLTGAAAMGQGTRTILAQIVADQLGGDLAPVSVTTGDSAGIAGGIGGFNSRQAVMAGNSAHLAAVKVRDKALAIAAHLLEAAEADLEIVGDKVRVKGASELGVTLAEVARAVAGMPGYSLPPGIAPGLEATEHMVEDRMAYTNGAAVAEVEVDPETGHVALLRFVLAHDCGRTINPMLVDGQLAGGIAHGIGNALFEWMGFDEAAQPVTTNFGEYLLVTATEMPPLDLLHQESPSPLNPLGVKGVGESGTIPAPAAIIAAIEDALAPFGVTLGRAPLRPHEIVALVRAARG
ncbi:MAG TPA: xanthine dehydrogenase family protein molybdopterin-binding subunit [Stellaceae bacterium]|nr:xanthine dehydrogenase family protein molybdopterin-binding subunit [Stellaceae bacterium]